MDIVIVRHGIAEPLGPRAARDEDRRLTRVGRARTEAAARGLLELGCRPDRIVYSPLVRTRETAVILAEVLRPDTEPETLDALAPDGRVEDLLKWLHGLREHTVLLVGHMPGVAELASALLGGGRVEVGIHFKKASACCISREEPGAPGLLRWHLPPRVLRALAGS